MYYDSIQFTTTTIKVHFDNTEITSTAFKSEIFYFDRRLASAQPKTHFHDVTHVDVDVDVE